MSLHSLSEHNTGNEFRFANCAFPGIAFADAIINNINQECIFSTAVITIIASTSTAT